MAAGDTGGRGVNATDVIVEAGKLAAEGKPYALATVVTVVRPASARRGDRALVTPDGVVTGWIGGACSEPTVVREALRALADREPRLARMEGGCASEGVVEVLIEPVLPAPLLAIVGESPAARTLGALARTVGWRVRGDGVEGADAVVEGADAVVVATMGRGDEDLLVAALESGAGYVGLVASARRAANVLAALRDRGLDEEAVLKVRAPAGLDLGPSSQEEIAVAILAELVAWRHTRGEAPLPAEPPAEAVDPVCGMTVEVGPEAIQAVHEGETVYFCSAHCKARFEAEPDRYSGLRAP
ncbi:MAG TPA: XdhC family protein [Gaiellaceae bacterium]|nr:XdhC family protein [Gaiellaceae bacterium]